MVCMKHQQLFQRRFQLWWNSIQQILNGKNVLIWILDTSYKINESSINQYFHENHFLWPFFENWPKDWFYNQWKEKFHHHWQSMKQQQDLMVFNTGQELYRRSRGSMRTRYWAAEANHMKLFYSITGTDFRKLNSRSVWFSNWVLELGLSLAQIIACSF